MYYDADYVRALEYGMPPTAWMWRRYRSRHHAADRRAEHSRRHPVSAHASGSVVQDAARLRRLAARLHARAQPALPTGLVPVVIAGIRVGDAQPAIARLSRAADPCLQAAGSAYLVWIPPSSTVRSPPRCWRKQRAHCSGRGLIKGWRDELLPVGDPPLAVVERAACRALGITTGAVHLNAYVDSDRMFVARRSAHKQIDPGLWDNLVGGMVPAGESLMQALSREALEEAGVQLDPLALLTGRRFQMRRPVAEGLQSEIIHVFDTALSCDEPLKNQDGEVEAIELRSIADVIIAIERNEFTLESALVIVESLTRRNCHQYTGWPVQLKRVASATGVAQSASSIHAI